MASRRRGTVAFSRWVKSVEGFIVGGMGFLLVRWIVGRGIDGLCWLLGVGA
jgi:hypothetical protein